jgi:Predicted Zn-dependent protease (DUF2268)
VSAEWVRRVGLALLGGLGVGAIVVAPTGRGTLAPGPTIHIEDVDRFYRLYDATGGHPTAEQLQYDYLDLGSDGLHWFATIRKVTGTAIAEAMARDPAMYANARRCLAVLPRARQRLSAALGRLDSLYPEARIRPLTIVVGRGKPVGVTDTTGVMIGLEALCAIDWLEPDVEDRFVHVLAHEYAHVQQAPSLLMDEHPTVLEASLEEGAAEFTAELISGSVAYTGFAASTRGREREIETSFVPDEDRTDLSRWLYNGTTKTPGDLGYWVGYRIVEAYYHHAADKGRALREILGMTDPHAFLEASGWRPGIGLGDS